jgi:hypothetical protein
MGQLLSIPFVLTGAIILLTIRKQEVVINEEGIPLEKNKTKGRIERRELSGNHWTENNQRDVFYQVKSPGKIGFRKIKRLRTRSFDRNIIQQLKNTER